MQPCATNGMSLVWKLVPRIGTVPPAAAVPAHRWRSSACGRIGGAVGIDVEGPVFFDDPAVVARALPVCCFPSTTVTVRPEPAGNVTVAVPW